MTAETLIRYRLFTAWQDHKEERWLEQMASEGWRLKKGGIRFVFERDEPRDVRYRLDWRNQYPQGKEEYFAMFRDAGWEHVGDYASWHYFRSPATANAPEVFTDAESRAAKYRRLLVLIVVIIAANLSGIISTLERLGRRSVFIDAMGIVQLCCVSILLYGALRLGAKIRTIRKSGKAGVARGAES